MWNRILLQLGIMILSSIEEAENYYMSTYLCHSLIWFESIQLLRLGDGQCRIYKIDGMRGNVAFVRLQCMFSKQHTIMVSTVCKLSNRAAYWTIVSK